MVFTKWYFGSVQGIELFSTEQFARVLKSGPNAQMFCQVRTKFKENSNEIFAKETKSN